MKDMLSTTKNEMSTWKSHRERASETRGEYWVRPAEVLALGFASYIEQIHQANALTDMDRARNLRSTEPERGPSFWEVDSIAAPFQALFDAAAPMGLAGKPLTIDPADLQVTMASNVEGWRTGRQEHVEAPTSPLVGDNSRMQTLR